MACVRTGLERLLLLGFGAARIVFLLQGVAVGNAWLVSRMAAPAEAPAWLREAMLSALLFSGIFFVAGLLLIAVRRWRVPHATGGSHDPSWPWPALLGLSLLAFSAFAAKAGAGLLPLWSEISTQLDAIGFWDGTNWGGLGGLVTIPILLTLSAPALVTAAALSQMALPLLLLPLLAARSRLFPTLLAMGIVCQVALVLGGSLLTDTEGRLAAQATTAMGTADDAEVARATAERQRWTDLLDSAANALVPPLLGMLAWLAFLRPSGAAAAFFTEFRERTEGTSPALVDVPRALRPEPTLPGPSIFADVSRRRGVARPATAPYAAAQRGRRALVVLGALILASGMADELQTRATFRSSQPAPGSRLEAAPAAVRVSFGAALDPASSLSLTRLVLPPYTGEQPKEVELTRHLASADPEQRTLEGVPSSLPPGLYRVSWRALPADGGVPRRGSFCFGVGVAVPTDDSNVVHSLVDRDEGGRTRRKTLAGGALLIALGVLLPLRLRR